MCTPLEVLAQLIGKISSLLASQSLWASLFSLFAIFDNFPSPHTLRPHVLITPPVHTFVFNEVDMEGFARNRQASNDFAMTATSSSLSLADFDDPIDNFAPYQPSNMARTVNQQSPAPSQQTFNGQSTYQFQQILSQPFHSQANLISTTAQSIKPMLNEKFTDPGYTPVSYIDDEDDFRLKMKAYLTLCDQELDHNAISDYPQDPQAQQQLVQELVSAMIYLGQDCEDAESKKSVNRLKKLSPIELNLMAWTILLAIRDCQLGKTSMPRWGKDWMMQEFATFQDRFDHVKAALHHVKASVASLFDYTFSKRLALNPHSEMGKIRGNKVVNGARRQDLALAKQEKQRRDPQYGTRRSKKQEMRANNAAVASQPQGGELVGLSPATNNGSMTSTTSAFQSQDEEYRAPLPLNGSRMGPDTGVRPPQGGELGFSPATNDDSMTSTSAFQFQNDEFGSLLPLNTGGTWIGLGAGARPPQEGPRALLAMNGNWTNAPAVDFQPQEEELSGPSAGDRDSMLAATGSRFHHEAAHGLLVSLGQDRQNAAAEPQIPLQLALEDLPSLDDDWLDQMFENDRAQRHGYMLS